MPYRSAATATAGRRSGRSCLWSPLQQPHPGRQLGLHIQHPLTGGDELLGEQVAQAAGALDRQVRSGHAAAHPISFSA